MFAAYIPHLASWTMSLGEQWHSSTRDVFEDVKGFAKLFNADFKISLESMIAHPP